MHIIIWMQKSTCDRKAWIGKLMMTFGVVQDGVQMRTFR
jgi:hypothetical protein